MVRPRSDRVTPAETRAQLERILVSPVFAGTERLSRFLSFIVEMALEGRAGEIKEYVIGLEVYQRKESFDPKLDSVVRVEASRLRSRLREYYETIGKNDPIRI